MADFETALAHHSAGRIELAKAGYEDMLRCEPGHPDALDMLGAISVAQGDPKCGIALRRQERWDAAIRSYRKAVSTRPGSVKA